MDRASRIAFLLLRGLDHFVPDLLAALPNGTLEARAFYVSGPDDIAQALAWADDPARDAVWFEFCWPPFPDLIARTDFEGRRVIVRVHRIEAYETPYAAQAPWHKVSDAVVVCEDMAACLRAAAPGLAEKTRLHVIHNGLDLARYAPAQASNPFRIGWCGSMILRKNPNLALEILHRLRTEDSRYKLHIAAKGGDRVAVDSFVHLARRMNLTSAVDINENVSQDEMPAWHARNAVLLSTSVHESFGYAIAEAAAVGCDLAVLDHAAAGEFWPEAVRFATVDEAVQRIRQARPHRWRSYVAERFGLERQVVAVRKLLNENRPLMSSSGAVPITHGAWRGYFLVRNHADHLQQTVTATGRFYEAEMLEDLRHRLTPDSVFVDVGANIGNHALFAAAVCGARVIAFEPSQSLAEHCAANLALNSVAKRVTLRHQGVGASSGRANLVPGPICNAGMTKLDCTDDNGTIEVVCLDDVLDVLGYLPTVIKVDVEGMELDVLRGAEMTLRLCRPTLYVEAADKDAYVAVNKFLCTVGYEVAAQFNATPTYLFVPRAQVSQIEPRTREVVL